MATSNRKPARPDSRDEWTDQDWMVHSINIHGIFFERWCRKTIQDAQVWTIRSVNYPVEFPPPNGPWRGQQSTLDIRAELQRANRRLTLLIECKKNDPRFVNWIFFPKYPSIAKHPLVLSYLDNVPHPRELGQWDVQGGLTERVWTGPLADEARETRGDYRRHESDDKTMTSNKAISDAAEQVALATQAIATEEAKFSRTLGTHPSRPPMPWAMHFFLPVIVTSARLYTCDFDPAHVDPATGEIPHDKATLKPQPQVLYEYPLPPKLQGVPVDLGSALLDGGGSLESFVRKHILVVHSGELAITLRWLSEAADVFFGGPPGAPASGGTGA